MKKLIFNTIVCAILIQLAGIDAVYANGDPVIHYSSVVKAGNPVARKIQDVQLVKEALYIQPEGLYTNVRVEYVLYNKSDKDYTDIDYGFPIDYTQKGKTGFEGDDISESIYEIGWAEHNIKNVAFFADGQSLQYSASDSIVKTPRKEYNKEMGDIVWNDGISRRWYYTHFQIKSKQSVKLTVIYSLYNSYTIALYAFHSSLLNRYFPYQLLFNYDFSPAQHWGDGTISDFTVTVDMNLLKLIPGSRQNRIEGLQFIQDGNIMTYHSDHFQLKHSKPLQIRFFYQGKLPSFYELANSRIDPSRYRLAVCGENPDYPASNLTDMNIETVWVSDRNIVGDSIVITMKKPIYITDMLLFNGNQKSESLWKQNGKLTKIKVDITMVDKELNSDRESTIISFDPKEQQYSYEMLDIGLFRHPMIINLTETYLLPLFADRKNKYDARIKKVKITILGTTPGTKYKDICVSEIMLLDIK